MTDCQHKLRNRAMLRNLTTLAPIVECKTHWSGNYMMFERFGRIYDEIRKVSEVENSTVGMDLTSVKRFERQLSQIIHVTLYLQTCYFSLSDFTVALEDLTESVSEKHECEASNLFGCLLGTKYMSANENIIKYNAFINGAVKNQRCASDQMTAQERFACKKLLVQYVPSSASQNSAEISDEDEETEMSMKIEKKRRTPYESEGPYVNSIFVLGYMASVERL